MCDVYFLIPGTTLGILSPAAFQLTMTVDSVAVVTDILDNVLVNVQHC